MRGRGPLCCVPTPRGIMDILSVNIWAQVQRSKAVLEEPIRSNPTHPRLDIVR